MPYKLKNIQVASETFLFLFGYTLNFGLLINIFFDILSANNTKIRFEKRVFTMLPPSWEPLLILLNKCILNLGSTFCLLNYILGGKILERCVN